MPNPKSKFSINEIKNQLDRLEPIKTISSNGYVYRIDFETHDNNVEYALEQYNSAKLDFEEGNITSEQYKLYHEEYIDSLEIYDIIDEDGKMCGEYSSKTKNYEIYYWRFVSEGKVYYYDHNRELWTYVNSYVGQLTCDMEIIRDTGIRIFSESDSDDDDEEDGDSDDEEDSDYDEEDGDSDDEEDSNEEDSNNENVSRYQ
jgi:hypothetical protein